MPRTHTTTRTALIAACTATTIAVTVTGCQYPTSTATATGPAVDQLAAVAVRVEDTGAHYDRDAWGDWTSRDGCDTREQILIAQGRGVQRGKGCTPVCPESGPACWTSPYDGVTARERADLQIDHRVPVKEAMRSGARTWSAAQRSRFYTDPANLVAASVHSNTSKGDRDPGVWRPTNRTSWCDYATAYTATKRTYGLSVDQREHDALVSMLGTCG